MALRLRRGTDAERLTITPLQGELVYVTDTKKLYVGDGATAGGVLVGPVDATAFDLVNDTTPQLGGDLDLNSNNITGTGNINIDGTITATGNINLGDADADSITVAGLINSSLRPAVDDAFDLGSASRNWKNIWTTQANVDTTLAVGSRIVKLGSGVEDSASVLWDAETDTIVVNNIISQNIQGNLVGSVFSDDSGTVLVDSVNSVLSNGTLSFTDGTISVNLLDEIIIDTVNLSHYIYGVTNSPDDMAYLSIVGSRGTREAPATVQAGDLLGSLSITGYNGTGTETKVLITGGIDTVTGTNSLPGKLLFSIHDYDGTYSTYGSLNSRGTFEMPVFKATPFANSSARDTAIPTPEAGMVIFNQNDDSTGVPQLQCYDGTNWVELH